MQPETIILITMAVNEISKDIASRAAARFEQEVQRAIAEIKEPNILLLGKTGVGKSSLVNRVFGDELARVSSVKPETEGFHVYKARHVPVRIIDSQGYEIVGEDNYRRMLNRYLDENFAEIDKQVHICWYCISVGAARVLPFDLLVLDMMRKRDIPVAVVLTQCDLDTADGAGAAAMRAVIERESKGDVPCFEVSNVAEVDKMLGQLPKLVDWSAAHIPDANLRLGFVAAQRVSLDQKSHAAEVRIRWYAASAAGVGATPIPVSDSLVLTGLQMKMSADIYTIYGFETSVGQGLRDLIQGKIASSVGKMLAGNLIKLVPGGGQIAGAAINATVASSVTYGMGRAVSAACRRACQAIWDGKYTELETLFSAEQIFDSFKKFTRK